MLDTLRTGHPLRSPYPGQEPGIYRGSRHRARPRHRRQCHRLLDGQRRPLQEPPLRPERSHPLPLQHRPAHRPRKRRRSPTPTTTTSATRPNPSPRSPPTPAASVTSVTTSPSPENYRCTQLTANAFTVIGQKPILGRDLLPADERAGARPIHHPHLSPLGKTLCQGPLRSSAARFTSIPVPSHGDRASCLKA